MALFNKTQKDESETLPVLCRCGNYEKHTGFDKHCHDAVEIIVALTGEIMCTAEDRTYMLKKGDIVLFNPYTIHSVYSMSDNATHLVLTFTLSEVLDFHDSASESCAKLIENGQYVFDEYYPADQRGNDVLFQHIMRLNKYIHLRGAANETIVVSELYFVLSVLFDKHYNMASGDSLTKRNVQFVQNLSNFLYENYNKQITTIDAAKALFLSKSRFSYLVKQYFGCSFSKYLRNYRIECAIKNFYDSNCTIKEISESVGFTDYCYFSHSFKEYTGFSPNVYLKYHQRGHNNMKFTTSKDIYKKLNIENRIQQNSVSEETAFLSREETANVISGIIENNLYLLPYKKEVDREYTDICEVDAENRYGVDVCAMLGLFPAFEDGSFRPKELLTEAEADRVVSALQEMIEQEGNAKGIVTCWDMINNPRFVYSNMTSSAESDNPLPVMRFTQYRTHEAPWYIGLDHVCGNISDSAMKYCKVCIRTEKLASPYMVLSSPVFSENITPYAIGEENGFVTYIFHIEEAFRNLRRTNLTAENPYADSPYYPLRNMHLKKLNSRYIRLALYPFGEEAAETADVLYFAFFADFEDAEQYTAAGDAKRYTEGRDTYSQPMYEEVTAEFVEENNALIERRVREIKGTPNVLLPEHIKGKCYYISSVNGNDDNDGLSPETAWKSITKLVRIKEGEWFSTPLTSYPQMEHIPKRGDGVFLERGSVFNAELQTGFAGDYAMWLVDGVCYGAYGEGEKPVITCCVDYKGSRNWVKTEYENVWMLDRTLDIPECTKQLSYNDIGNIIVKDKNGVTGYGIKVLAANPEDPFNGENTVTFGKVTTGFEIYESGNVPFTDPGCLRNNLEYFHDWIGARVYMYCDKGNPGEVFESVVLAKQGIGAYGGSDCIVDNLAFKYIGAFGISTHNIKNLTVQNCTFEWTGGSIQEEGITIFGGGVQNWCSCDGFYIRNCYSNQSLDASFSTQGMEDRGAIMHDFVVENCVAINANSSVEIWNYSPKNRLVANTRVRDNLFGYVGYHFGSRKIITHKDACILQFGIGPGHDQENVIFERNLCMYASSACYWARPFLGRGDTVGTFLRDNTYILSNRKAYMLTSPDMRNNLIDTRCRCVLFTEETLREMTGLGIDRGSRFCYVDGYAFEGEEDGLYIPPYFVVPSEFC